MSNSYESLRSPEPNLIVQKVFKDESGDKDEAREQALWLQPSKSSQELGATDERALGKQNPLLPTYMHLFLKCVGWLFPQ